jgi:tetratricopeptide (TPR) repeat protein
MNRAFSTRAQPVRSNWRKFMPLIGWLLLTILCLLLPLSAAFARSNAGIGQAIFEKMVAAQERIEQKDFAGANEIVTGILAGKGLNSYEKAQAWSLRGNIHYQQEQIDQALTAFRTAIGFEDLPEGFYLVTLRTLAQLSFMEDHLDDAQKYTEQLLAKQKIADGDTLMLLAQIHYRRDAYPLALKYAQQAIELEKSKGHKVKENWLLVLNAVYYSLDDLESMAKVLEQLIQLYPKSTYLINLAAIYGQLGSTEKQLLLLEPLYDQRALTQETHLINLANLMILHKVPYKGARVLEQGFANGTIKRNQRNVDLLAQAFYVAAETERSLVYLAEAANLDQTGQTDLRLAQNYSAMYRWQDAEKSLNNAIKKGHLKREGDAHLLLGMVRFNQSSFDSARAAFLHARSFKESEELAKQWLVYVEKEQEKAKLMDAGG